MNYELNIGDTVMRSDAIDYHTSYFNDTKQLSDFCTLIMQSSEDRMHNVVHSGIALMMNH